MSLAGSVGSAVAGALKKFGASATIQQKSAGIYDPTTGSTSSTSTTTGCRAQLDATSLRTLGSRFGEDLVQGGDQLATIAALGLPRGPEPQDILTVASTPLVVIAVRPTYVGGVAVMFECLVRR